MITHSLILIYSSLKCYQGWLVHTRKEIFTSKGNVYMNLNNGDYEMDLDDVCLT